MNDYIEYLPNSVPLEMTFVQGGTFQMGSKAYESEQPIHEVKVPDFHLGIYPITNEQFLPFLQAKGNQKEGGRTWVNLEGSYENVRCGIRQQNGVFEVIEGLEQHPMIYVSWYGASAYCQWLSEQTGKSYHLPSEAEWEYAACGGKHQSPFRYAGSNKLKEVAWYERNSHGETKAIGQKLPNELGIYDMSGNVYEWCADHWHSNYENAPQDGSAWIKDGNERIRVVRGGSWNDVDFIARVSDRNRINTDFRFNFIGFRIAR